MTEGLQRVMVLVIRRPNEGSETLNSLILQLENSARAQRPPQSIECDARFRSESGTGALILSPRSPLFDPKVLLEAIPGFQTQRQIRTLCTTRSNSEELLRGYDLKLGAHLRPSNALLLLEESAASCGRSQRERRRAQRFPAPKTLKLELWREGDPAPPFQATASNLALTGAFITQEEYVPPLGEVMQVHIQGDIELRLSAKVVFHLSAAQAARLGRSKGYGLKFISFSAHGRERLLDLLDSLATRAGLKGRDRRANHRYPIRLRLMLNNNEEVQEFLSNNLSSGGLFLKTRHPPATGNRVQVMLCLPQHPNPIQIHGQVSHVTKLEATPDSADPAQEHSKGTEYGVGIAFADNEEDTLATLHQYLDGLENQGTTRILLVEDTKFFRTLLGESLRALGYTVEESPTAEDALARLEDNLLDLDLLILDLELPGMSGLELLAELRSQGVAHAIPLLVLSGKVTPAAGTQLADGQHAVFLPKETPMQVLLMAIQDLLSELSGGAKT